MISYSICLSLSDVSLSVMPSKSIHVATNGKYFYSIYFFLVIMVMFVHLKELEKSRNRDTDVENKRMDTKG